MLKLPERWKEYLDERGIPAWVVDERGYRAVKAGRAPSPDRLSADGANPEDFAAHYGFPATSSGLLIPLYDVRGGAAGYTLRSDGGAAPKFRAPRGQRNALTALPSMLPALRGAREAIFVVEGTTRADALAGLGVPAIAMNGCWGWRGKNETGGRTALPDWDDVSIAGNRFAIALDGDARVNPQVAKALERLAAFLRGRGADAVHAVHLPAGDGLDDWIGQRRASGVADEEIRRALGDLLVATEEVAGRTDAQRRARKALVDALGGGVPVADGLDADLVKEFAQELRDGAEGYPGTPVGAAIRFVRHYGNRLLIARNEDSNSNSTYRPLFVDDRGVWRGDDRTFIDAFDALHVRLDVTFRAERVSGFALSHLRSMLGDGVRTAIGRIHVHGSTGLGLGWRGRFGVEVCDERELDADGRYLGCANGVLDLAAGRLLSADEARGKRVTFAEAVAYRPERLDEPEPYGIGALRATWGNERLEYALDWCGRALWGAPDKSFLVIVGPKDSGKGTLYAMLAGALGGRNVQALSADALRSPAGERGRQGNTDELAVLEQARIAYAEEVEDWRIGAARLKSMTGGVGTQFALMEKWKSPRTARLRAQILLTANSAPSRGYGANSEGMASRMRVVQYALRPEPDARVKDSLAEPEALEWLLATLAARARRFRPPAELPVPQFVLDAVEEQRLAEQTPLEQFVEDRLEIVPARASGIWNIGTAEIWSEFAAHCGAPEDADSVGGVNRLEMARELRRLLRLPPVKMVSVSGVKARGWSGVRWRGAVDTSLGMRAPMKRCTYIEQLEQGERRCEAPSSEESTIGFCPVHLDAHRELYADLLYQERAWQVNHRSDLRTFDVPDGEDD